MGVAGTYNCIASTSIVTLWSFDVHVAVIKQPVIAVTPQVGAPLRELVIWFMVITL